MADFRAIARKYPEFSPEDVEAFIEAFKQFDIDGNGSIDHGELATILRNMGQNPSKHELDQQIAEVDLDKSGTIDFNEFLLIIRNLTKGKSSAFGQTVQKASKVVQKNRNCFRRSSQFL